VSLLLHEDAPSLLGSSAFLAKVTSVQDPGNRNRVQVRILNANGVADQDGPIWARVAVPFAGSQRGAFFIPDVDDEVLVVFLSSDPRFPVVVGSLWNGSAKAPETLGGAGNSVDRWTITGKAGTRIAIVEQPAGSATIEFSTPGGLTGTMTDEGGGSIKFTNSANTTVTIDSSGITLNAPTGKVQITAASEIDLNAPLVNVSASMSQFAGIVQCQVLQTPSVVAASYTPGAGNIL
jgi:uncharacterized protein involved in type VI secretion and phage assembly